MSLDAYLTKLESYPDYLSDTELNYSYWDELRNSGLYEDTFINYLKNGRTLSLSDNNITEGAYSGSRRKVPLLIDGNRYIGKYSIRSESNVMSEIIASNFAKSCGFSVHSVLRASLNGELVAACKDFAVDKKLLEYSDISSYVSDANAKTDYYVSDVLNIINKFRETQSNVLPFDFASMCVLDAIVGNGDRHLGNWGFLRDSDKHSYRLSPIYDLDASLFPRANPSAINEDWVKERTLIFPNSKIMVRPNRERGKFYDLLRDKCFPKSALDTYSSLDVVKHMSETCAKFNVTEEWARLYCTIVYYRHRCLVKGDTFLWEGFKDG